MCEKCEKKGDKKKLLEHLKMQWKMFCDFSSFSLTIIKVSEELFWMGERGFFSG